MNCNYNIKEISDSSNELQVRINTFKLKQLQKDENRHTSNFMRIWNEGATLFLFAIVFLVILKDSFHWISGLLGMIGLAFILYLGIRLYKKTRKK